MATIRQRGTRSWQIRVDAPTLPGLPRQRHYLTIKITDPHILASKRRVQQYLEAQAAQLQAQVLQGTPPAPQPAAVLLPMTVEQFAQRWDTEHISTTLEYTSQKNYRHFLQRWILPVLGKMPITAVQPMHITHFLASMRKPGAGLTGKTVGDATVLYCYRVLRSMFMCAKEWQVIEASPMAGIRKPRERSKPDVDFYDEDEIAAVGDALANASAELRSMVLLALSGGLRRAEIAGLQWRHIDFEAGTISIRQSLPRYDGGTPYIKSPKTKSSRRTILMTPDMAQALQEHKATQHITMYRPGSESIAPAEWKGAMDFVFRHPSGRPVDPQRLTKWWQEFHRRHGLRHIRLHDLRHTAAAWLIKSNQHPKTIAGVLGHAQIKTSMDTYGHMMPSLYPQAAAAMAGMPLGKKNPAQGPD